MLERDYCTESNAPHVNIIMVHFLRHEIIRYVNEFSFLRPYLRENGKDFYCIDPSQGMIQ